MPPITSTATSRGSRTFRPAYRPPIRRLLGGSLSLVARRRKEGAQKSRRPSSMPPPRPKRRTPITATRQTWPTACIDCLTSSSAVRENDRPLCGGEESPFRVFFGAAKKRGLLCAISGEGSVCLGSSACMGPVAFVGGPAVPAQIQAPERNAHMVWSSEPVTSGGDERPSCVRQPGGVRRRSASMPPTVPVSHWPDAPPTTSRARRS